MLVLPYEYYVLIKDAILRKMSTKVHGMDPDLRHQAIDTPPMVHAHESPQVPSCTPACDGICCHNGAFVPVTSRPGPPGGLDLADGVARSLEEPHMPQVRSNLFGGAAQPPVVLACIKRLSPC